MTKASLVESKWVSVPDYRRHIQTAASLMHIRRGDRHLFVLGACPMSNEGGACLLHGLHSNVCRATRQQATVDCGHTPEGQELILQALSNHG